MIEWILLISLASIWTIFATIQDLRTTEVSNWLTYSLITIGLGVRAIFAILNEDPGFFFWGTFSTLLMVGIAFALYFSNVFAGGDAMLLMGLGTLIPGNSVLIIIFNCLLSIVTLLLVGSLYSFVASFFIISRRKKDFLNAFKKQKKHYRLLIPIGLLISFFLYKMTENNILLTTIFLFAIISYPYLKAVDKSLHRTYSPSELREGDWLLYDVKIGKYMIKKSVHGLSLKEIQILRKHKKKVMIREGIAFVPAFLIAFLVMVFFFVFGIQERLPLFSLLS